MLWICVCNFYISSKEIMYILDRLTQFCPYFVTNPFNNTKTKLTNIYSMFNYIFMFILKIKNLYSYDFP